MRALNSPITRLQSARPVHRSTPTRLPLLLAGLFLAAVSVTAPAETVVYKGTATYNAHRELLPLSNGGAAVHVVNRVVGTIAPSTSGGFIFGDCVGLAYLSPEAEISMNSICTFMENQTDGFTLRGTSTIEGGEHEILGGTGKFQGATGTGKMRRTWLEGDRGSLEYELTVTTP